jgi:hypothetical protein
MSTQSIPKRQLPILTLLLATLVLAGASANVPTTQTKPGAQTDLRSIDSLLKVFYESLSFPEGKSPDWDRFRNLFASATSPCIRIAGDSVMQMDRESFIAFFSGRIRQGTLRSFDEKEIGRTGEYYGNLAQVFSTYVKQMNLADQAKPIRGINSFQLFFKNGRWWIASVTWQDESSDKPIPENYLGIPLKK